MNAVVRLVPEECVEVFNGNSKTTGNAYTIGTWTVKGVLDGKLFAVKAFTAIHEVLNNSKGLILDAEISVVGKEYNGKWYNDVSIVSLMNQTSAEDVPTQQAEQSTPAAPVFNNGGEDDENVLPF